MIDLSEEVEKTKEVEKKLPFAVYFEKDGGDTFSCGGSLRDGSDEYLNILIDHFKISFLEAEKKKGVEMPEAGSSIEYYISKNWCSIFYTPLPRNLANLAVVDDDNTSGVSVESGTVESIQYEIDLYVDKKIGVLKKEIARLQNDNSILRNIIQTKSSSQLYMSQIQRLYTENVELKRELAKN